MRGGGGDEVSSVADEGGGGGGDGEEEVREGDWRGRRGVGARSEGSREDGPDEADVGELKMSGLMNRRRKIVSRSSREQEEREDEFERLTLSEQIVSTTVTMVERSSQLGRSSTMAPNEPRSPEMTDRLATERKIERGNVRTLRTRLIVLRCKTHLQIHPSE